MLAFHYLVRSVVAVVVLLQLADRAILLLAACQLSASTVVFAS